MYKTELLAGGIALSVLFYVIVMWMLRSEELKFIVEDNKEEETPVAEIVMR